MHSRRHGCVKSRSRQREVGLTWATTMLNSKMYGVISITGPRFLPPFLRTNCIPPASQPVFITRCATGTVAQPATQVRPRVWLLPSPQELVLRPQLTTRQAIPQVSAVSGDTGRHAAQFAADFSTLALADLFSNGIPGAYGTSSAEPLSEIRFGRSSISIAGGSTIGSRCAPTLWPGCRGGARFALAGRSLVDELHCRTWRRIPVCSCYCRCRCRIAL